MPQAHNFLVAISSLCLQTAPPMSTSLQPSRSLDKLHALLKRGARLTTAEIIERLDVTRRHARRLVRQLREEHDLPIEGEREGREKRFFLPETEWQAADVALDLTEREALALVLAAKAARSNDGAPLAGALQGVLGRLIDDLSGSVMTFEPDALMDHLHIGAAASVTVDPEVFLTLLRAISHRRRVAIDYHKASTDTYQEGRTIEPWGLAERGGAWMCVARDPAKAQARGDDGMRDFNLARIDAVRRADPDSRGGDYTIPGDFDLELYFIDRFEALDDTTVHEVRLLVEPDRLPYFRSKQYHRTQQIHDEEGEAERAVVSYEVAGLDEIAAFVRSWGPGVTVLDPPELAERIADDARAVAARYASAASPDGQCQGS